MASLDDLPVFIPDFQEFMARGEELVLEQARKCPMARGMFGLELFRRDDVQTALRDRRIEARISLALLAQGVTDGQLFDTLSNSLLNINGPEHQRQRSLVGKAFTPASVERIRPAMRDLANELIDEFAPHGEVEFMESFANQYPVQVICTMLGVPRIERHTFRIWLDTISFALA